MSKFHRNRKKDTDKRDKQALWLIIFAILLIAVIFVFTT